MTIRPKYEKQRKRQTLGARSRTQVEQNRDGIFLRDDYRCLAANTSWTALFPCGGGLTIQHRIGKGMGGSAEFDTPAHLITLCMVHNTLEPANAAFRNFCVRNGWSVPRNRGLDVEQIPVTYPDGNYYQLSDIGFGRIYLTPERAKEMRAVIGIEVV